MSLRVRISIPKGKLNDHLSKLDGDVKFELVRLATNGLLIESNHELNDKDAAQVSSRYASQRIEPELNESENEHYEDELDVDFGEAILEIE